MTATPPVHEPTLTYLADGDKQKIHHTALRVLDEIGMTLMHDGALALLKEAGARVEDDNTVKLDPEMVRRAVASAPKRVRIYNREGDLAMDLGGRRAYFGTGSDLIYALDGTTLERHHCRLNDVQRAARVADALPNIDFIMSFAHPNEIAPERAYLESFKAMAANSVKPIVCTAAGRDDLTAIWQVSKILRGGESALQEKPYWVQYAEPISPLKHPFDSVDKLLLCAETRMPVIYSPAPIAGSTAPMTVAGHIAQGLAECFFGLVIHQLRAEGAPFLMGMGAAVLDMVTSQCSYNAPEYLMAYMGMVEMSHYFDIPNWGYAGTSDAQIPDGQATLEAALETYMATAVGSNLNHDVGYLDFGRTGSLEMMVIMNEVIDMIRRMQRGIVVDDEHLALEAIAEAGRQGQFLTHGHTLRHVRSTQWRPQLICRQGHEKWLGDGRDDLLGRARKRVAEILDSHRPVAIAPEKANRIGELVASFKA